MRPPKHPPGYLNMRDDKYYTIEVRCNNCGVLQTVSISKGVRVDQVLPDSECENCECVGTLEFRK